MWLGGYAFRTGPSTGIRSPLYARALVLDDAEGNRSVLLSTDNLGFGRALVEKIAKELG